MLRLASRSSYAQILHRHFDYIWSGTNPYIKTRSLAEVAGAMQVTV